MTEENRKILAEITRNMYKATSKAEPKPDPIKAYMPIVFCLNADKREEFYHFAWHNNRIPIMCYRKDSDTPVSEVNKLHTGNMVLMGKCEELWIVSNDPLSPGDKEIIDRAKLRHKKTRYFEYRSDRPDDLYFVEV